MVLSLYKKIQTITKVSQPVLMIKVLKIFGSLGSINMELMHKKRVLVIPIAAHDLLMLKVCNSTSRVKEDRTSTCNRNQYLE